MVKLERFPLKGNPLYTILMFFAREMDTQLLKTVRRIRFHKASLLMKTLYLLREFFGKLGLRRCRYTQVLKFLYRNSNKYGPYLKGYDALIYSSINTLDKRILHEAKNRGLKLICWVYSWDHPVKDNEFLSDADHYLVLSCFPSGCSKSGS